MPVTSSVRGDARAGQQRDLDKIGESVALADIVYGLGGAASLDGGRAWEVIWLACREVVLSNGAIKRMQLEHDTHGVTFA
jgi:hypothetical protein